LDSTKIIVLLTFLMFFLSSCEQKTITSQNQEPIEVGFINAKKENISLNIELNGRVKAKEIAQIRPQITGIIKKRLFVEGSYVKKDDILYEIDSSTYEATHNQAQASLNSAKAQLISAEANFKRAKELFAFDGVSKQELDDIEASYLQAKALVEERIAILENAKIDLDRCNIKAPISGHIGISNVTKGALVLANQDKELASIKDSRSVFVDLNLSYGEYLTLRNSIDLGKNSNIKVSLILEDNSIYPHIGYLQARELDASETTGTITLRAIFKNPDDILIQGVFVKAIIENPKKVDAFLIPQQTILRDQKANPLVYLLNDDLTITQKSITLQRAIDNFWLVTSNEIEDNSKIIIEGLNKINPNSKITVKDMNTKYFKE